MQTQKNEVSKNIKSPVSLLSKQKQLYLQAADKPWMIQFLLLPLLYNSRADQITKTGLQRTSFSSILHTKQANVPKLFKTHTIETLQSSHQEESKRKTGFYLVGNLPFNLSISPKQRNQTHFSKLDFDLSDSRLKTQDGFLRMMRKTILNSSSNQFEQGYSNRENQIQQNLVNSVNGADQNTLPNILTSGNTRKNGTNFLAYWLLPFLSLVPLVNLNSSVSQNWTSNNRHTIQQQSLNLGNTNYLSPFASENMVKNKQISIPKIATNSKAVDNIEKPDLLIQNYLKQSYFFNTQKKGYEQNNNEFNSQLFAEVQTNLDKNASKLELSSISRLFKIKSLWFSSRKLNYETLTQFKSKVNSQFLTPEEFALKTSKAALSVYANQQPGTRIEPTRIFKEFKLHFKPINHLSDMQMNETFTTKLFSSENLAKNNDKASHTISRKGKNALRIAVKPTMPHKNKTQLEYSFFNKLILKSYQVPAFHQCLTNQNSVNSDYYSLKDNPNQLAPFSSYIKSSNHVNTPKVNSSIHGATKFLNFKHGTHSSSLGNSYLSPNIFNYTPLQAAYNTNIFKTSSNESSLKNASSARLITDQTHPSPSNYIKYIKAKLHLATNYWLNSSAFYLSETWFETAKKQLNHENTRNLDLKLIQKTKQYATSVVLNHKKFAYTPNTTEVRTEANVLNQDFVVYKDEIRKGSLLNQSELKYMERKKDIQKKRKAKKLRLESRRQKKRKRFYPRPVWLRLRLALSSTSTKLAIPNKNITMASTQATRLEKFTKPSTPFLSSMHVQTTRGQTMSNRVESNTIISRFFSKSMATGSKRIKTLLKVKNKANYANFEVKSANNTLPKKETKNAGMLAQSAKDFWIWLYNMSNNTFICRQSLILSKISAGFDGNSTNMVVSKSKEMGNYFGGVDAHAYDNGTSSTKQPLYYLREKGKIQEFWTAFLKKQEKQNAIEQTSTLTTNNISSDKAKTRTKKSSTALVEGALKTKTKNYKYAQANFPREKTLQMISWAFNKTNLSTISNKRFSIWSTQKLRNQSKNNKTKFLEKKLKKYIDLAFSSPSASNLWFNSNSSSYNWKDVIQPSLDVTKHTRAATGVDVKLKKRISRKIHQKEQKLMFLSSRSLLTSAKVAPLANQVYQSGSSHLVWWSNLPLIDFSASNLATFASDKVLHTQEIFVREAPFIGLLVHFCALISLLSISQVRCFVKFHLILLHKLSSFYIDILLDTALKIHSNMNNLLKIAINSKSSTLFSSGNTEPLWFGTYLRNGVKSSGEVSSNNSTIKVQAKTSSFLSSNRKNAFNLAMLQKDSAETRKNTRIVYYRKLSNQNILDRNPPMVGLGQDTKTNSKQVINQLQNYIKVAHPALVRTDQSNLTKKKPTSINQKWLNIYFMIKQLEVTQFYQLVLTGIKKQTVNTSFQIVDTFESWLKFIYSFFEKPAEFTMDWIAYAFLVEWSSDLLAFTPHTNERTNWTAFSKYTRQNTIGLALYNTASMNHNSNSLGNSLQMSGFNSHLPLSQLTVQSSNVFLKSSFGAIYSLAFSQFLTKRLLYLNDLLLTMIYRPDTDLIYRQKKGTLFWDIWSDLLIKAADKYNINIPSLSNIKEEQNVLLDNFLATSQPLLSASTGPTNQKSVSKLTKIQSDQKLNKQTLLSSNNNFEKVLINFIRQHSQSTLMGQNHFDFQIHSPNKIGRATETCPNMLQNSTGYTNTLNGFYSENIESDFHSCGGTTYQSKETDLFIHQGTPTSLNYLSAIKYYTVVQQPIGNIVCQIFAGLLNKQIAKNVLVIGSTLGSNIGGNTGVESLQKTLLIQALAGETEMKIITDNASRYAVVNRGFAVGIKYLKEVFEAITLNTPCLFLLEDIHLIGERRPLLISDHGDSIGSSGASDLSKSAEATFGSQRNGDAVHEKNQIYYQLSRHGITHYKKPFKGDFSLTIPSNHFAFDLFLKPRQKNVNTTTSVGSTAHPFASQINLFGRTQSLNSTGQNDNSNSQSGSNSNTQNSQRNMSEVEANYKNKQIISRVKPDSALGFDPNTGRQLGMQSGSPFSVLLLKEQKKFKANKIVNELPWVGLPSEQLAILPRVSYSVRAKVSALAELGFSNMSAKLDMITDLLVIIDSVRGHRGFVVFATTHLPHILDPALRRPGRLDETISIPTLSNLWTRWEFSKHTLSFSISENKMDSTGALGGLSSFSVNSWDRAAFATQNVQRYFQQYINANSSLTGTIDYFSLLNLNIGTKQQAIIKTSIFSPILTGFQKLTQLENTGVHNLVSFHRPFTTENGINGLSQKITKIKDQKKVNTLYSSVRHIAYFQMGKKMITTKFAFNLSNSTPIYLNPALQYHSSLLSKKSQAAQNQAILATTEATDVALLYGAESLKYKSLYSSSSNLKNVVISLMAGKFSEYFAFTNTNISKTKTFSTLETVTLNGSLALSNSKSISFSTQIKPSIQFLNGINQTWRAATTFVLSVLQKRYLFHKNLIVPKLLNFLDYNSLEEPPSPPSSNILIPAKRYENSKKSFKQCIQKNLYGLGTSTINEKLQSHKKQSYIKSIYSTNSTAPKEAKTNQLESLTANLLSVTANDINKTLLLQPTNATQIYQMNLLKRHRMSLNNQWWNGQLTEHTAESLFLSDIDWRYTFIPENSSSTKKMQNEKQRIATALNLSGLTSTAMDNTNQVTSQLLTKHENIVRETSETSTKSLSKDIVIDFPDADQLYNPKHRRWFVTTGYWASWFNFDKELQAEFVNHLILESVINSYSFLNNNRELLDYSAAKFLKKGLMSF